MKPLLYSPAIVTPKEVCLGKVGQPLGKKREAHGCAQGIHYGPPGRAGHRWPDTPHLTIRRCGVDRIGVRGTGKREVGVRIKNESVGIGHQASPTRGVGDSIANCDPWTFALTNACDLTDYAVGFQVTSERALTESETNVKTTTHKDTKVACPIVPPRGSFMIPNIGTTLAYSGWLMNSAMIRM